MSGCGCRFRFKIAILDPAAQSGEHGREQVRWAKNAPWVIAAGVTGHGFGEFRHEHSKVFEVSRTACPEVVNGRVFAVLDETEEAGGGEKPHNLDRIVWFNG